MEVFTVDGQGSYVDAGTSTTVGSRTIGSKVIGGGGDDMAHPFDVTFPVHTDIYQRISAKFEATDVGYAAFNYCVYYDNRDMGRRRLVAKTV